MIFTNEMLTYFGIVALLTITPGADVMLVIRNALSGGAQAGARTTLGICSGLMVHVILSAMGVSLILVRSVFAFSAVKFLGAVYLVFLGGQSLWKANGKTRIEINGERVAGAPGKNRKPFVEGALTNVFNPKVAVFYLAFLPQFIDIGDAILLKSLMLGGIHILMSFLWLLLLSVLMGKLQHIFTRSRWQRGLETVSGLVLIGLGLRLAIEQA